MININEHHVQGELHSSSRFSSQQCWRCQCFVPEEQLRRRVVNTSSSRGTHLVTDATVSIKDRYEIVNLCSSCAKEFTTRKQAQHQVRAFREAWWGRLGLGLCFAGMLLSVRQPPMLIFALAWLLDRLRVLGLAILLMGGVFLVEYLLGLQPYRFHRRVRIPWFVVINGVILWGIWRTDLVQKSLARLIPKRSSAATAPPGRDELPHPSENRELS